MDASDLDRCLSVICGLAIPEKCIEGAIEVATSAHMYKGTFQVYCSSGTIWSFTYSSENYDEPYCIGFLVGGKHGQTL